jgi:plasmid stabilization system protein ParE
LCSSGVEVELVQLRLLGAHVLQRADDRAEFGIERLIGQPRTGRLRHAKVDDLGDRLAIVQGDQDIRRLEVAMDDPLLVRVLHRLADRDRQLESLAQRQPAFVTELGDRDALDQLHHEVGTAVIRRPGVEDLGDRGVVHQGQCLAFGPKACEDLAAIHASLDELQRHRPPHRLGLLGHVDRAHAPLADRLEQLVRTDDRAGPLGDRSQGSGRTSVRSLRLRDVARLRINRSVSGGFDRRVDHPNCGSQESADPLVVPQERLDLRPQLRVASTCLVQVHRSLRATLPDESLGKYGLELGRVHRCLRN